MAKKVGIVGAGMMGSEIALVFAQTGWSVIMSDASVAVAEKAKVGQAKVLDKSIQKGKLDASKKDGILALIKPGTISDMADCDLVIEAAIEDFDIKTKLFQELDKVCKPECILSSNTSSIPITKLAATVSKPRSKKFLGLHFFSPATVMKLVEVIPAYQSDRATIDFGKATMTEIGKTPVEIKDVAGFAVNRLLNIFFIEAIRLLEEGVATVEDIDTACKLGLGHPVGPFQLLDITTLDLNLKVHEVLFKEYGERFMPRPLLRKMNNAGLLGRKTGEGFYKYEK